MLRLSVCLSVCLPACACLSVCLSVCLLVCSSASLSVLAMQVGMLHACVPMVGLMNMQSAVSSFVVLQQTCQVCVLL